jgi:DNA-binding NtrC family response regulator
VRELKNLIERAVLIGKGEELEVKDLGLYSHKQEELLISAETGFGFAGLPLEGMDLSEQLQNFERHYIKAALKITNGNESKAAKLLNMNHHSYLK